MKITRLYSRHIHRENSTQQSGVAQHMPNLQIQLGFFDLIQSGELDVYAFSQRTGYWEAHQHPRCPLLISRNLTIPRPIMASFLAKRKWPTSVSPRSISSIRKTLAAACS